MVASFKNVEMWEMRLLNLLSPSPLGYSGRHSPDHSSIMALIFSDAALPSKPEIFKPLTLWLSIACAKYSGAFEPHVRLLFLTTIADAFSK